jgi:hypothetical protein
MENTQDVNLIIGIEERLSWWQNILYGVQQLTVDTTVLIVPICWPAPFNYPPKAVRSLCKLPSLAPALLPWVKPFGCSGCLYFRVLQLFLFRWCRLWSQSVV